MKFLVVYCGILLQTTPDFTGVWAVTEKLTTIALLAIGVYVLYKRDVAKEKKFDALQERVFEVEKKSIEAITKFDETLNRMDETQKLLIQKLAA